MYDPLSVEERHTLARYLKHLSEGLGNVVQLLQKRGGSASLLDMAAAAQINIDVVYREMLNAGDEYLMPKAANRLLVVPKKTNGKYD